ncbi:regulatory protein TetR [Candidatus Vecturithrix granuli]|uniref:Regulatory protein TetR n=1 Tax=Vecturithrix granuli TaxID=1499967 RepID=A0A081C868_VECG1|nr:regulatory protein TetR [Candidatus Vecturithrix granuli]
MFIHTMNSTELQVSKKHQQIVATAEELFLKHGLKRVSVEEICQKAGVSRMTFYRCFANKTVLMQHIWDRWIEDAYRKLDEVENMPIPFPEKLRLMQDYKLEMTAKMSTDFIEEVFRMDFYQTSAEAWKQRVMQFLTDAQKRGDIRPEVRPELILVLLNKLTELVNDDSVKHLYADYVELTREIWNFFYYGLINRNEE